MEEKESYEVMSPSLNGYAYIHDFKTDNVLNTYDSCDLLNQQDKRIRELEEDQALLTMLISGIDNLMHDKDYRFKNDNGTWYSRQSCKDLTREEVYQEIIDEINQLDSNFEILDKENQQLKQQLEETELEAVRWEEHFNQAKLDYNCLKEELAEKDKEIEKLKTTKDFYKSYYISFKEKVIDELEKVKNKVPDFDSYDDYDYMGMYNYIDQQIASLKGKNNGI